MWLWNKKHCQMCQHQRVMIPETSLLTHTHIHYLLNFHCFHTTLMIFSVPWPYKATTKPYPRTNPLTLLKQNTHHCFLPKNVSLIFRKTGRWEQWYNAEMTSVWGFGSVWYNGGMLSSGPSAGFGVMDQIQRKSLWNPGVSSTLHNRRRNVPDDKTGLEKNQLRLKYDLHINSLNCFV